MRTFAKAFSFRLFLSVALAGMVYLPLWANDSDTDPGLGVARLSLTNGDVTVQRGNSGDWIEAQVNTPLVAGDTIAVGPSSRAEVQLDHSNLLRLGENSEVYLAELENKSFKIEVARGLVTYAELRGGEADVDIETPDASLRPMKNGSYRVQVFENGETEITVRKGKAEVISRQGSELLKQGQSMLVRANPADGSVEFQVAKASSRDDWDRWNEQRDKQLKQSASYHRVSRDIYGVEVLDAHGRWVYVPRYGYAWSPYVRSGWAPYRHGRWAWLDYYGWTWVSYEPWGWAPYHYGRWSHHASFGWVWYPGHRHARHHWRPALVAFFGYGSHSGFRFGVGFGYGHIGWIPLGPRDPYYPWYGRRHRRTHVNININIYNVYQNARVRGGVTLLDARDFSRGRLRNVRSLREAELHRARLIHGQLPVVPERAALGRVARHSRRGERRLQAARQARLDARRNGRQAQRLPFEQQQERIAARLRAGSTAAGGSRRTASAAGESRGRQLRENSAGVRMARVQNSFTGRSRAAAGVVNNSQGTSGRYWQRFESSERNAERARRSPSADSRAHRATTRQEERRRSTRRADRGSSIQQEERRRSTRQEDRRGSIQQEERSRSTRRSFSPNGSRATSERSNRNRRVSRPRNNGSTPSARSTRQAPRAPARVQSGQRREASRSAVRGTAGNKRSKATPRGRSEARPKARAGRERP